MPAVRNRKEINFAANLITLCTKPVQRHYFLCFYWQPAHDIGFVVISSFAQDMISKRI